MVKLKIIPSLDEDLLCSTMGSKENGHQIRAHYTANLPKFFFFLLITVLVGHGKVLHNFLIALEERRGKKSHIQNSRDIFNKHSNFCWCMSESHCPLA